MLEFATSSSAAYAARLLVDLGASVTKVIPPGARTDEAAVALDRGKRLLVIDPMDAAGDITIGTLLLDADVVVCAGMLVNLGRAPLSLAERRTLHPRLITAAISPFGESGPHAGYQGSDLIAFQAGGLGYGTPPRVDDPEREYPLGLPGDAVSMLAGLVSVIGILHALVERDRDGHGRHVEISMQEVVASLVFNNLGGYIDDGEEPSRLAKDRPNARRPLLPCRDGDVVAMVNRPAHVRAWLELFGADAREVIARIDAGAPPAALTRAIDDLAVAWAKDWTRREVTELAQSRHIPVEPVLDSAELLACPHLNARGFFSDPTPEGIRVPSHPFGPISLGEAERVLPASVEPVSSPIPNPHPPSPPPGPLAGVRVIDFGWIFAAPIATRIMAALGADVIRVETPRNPDPMRRRPFAMRAVNGGKRGVVLDARVDAEREALLALLRRADAVVENFSTGVMERLGLGWEVLHALNPRLIMLSVSGLGRTGPYADHVMFGQLAQGYAGVTAMVGYEGGPPRGIEDGGLWSDPVTGYAAAVAVLAALRERAVTGSGRRIDISLVEATAALFVRPLIAAQRGDVWRPRGNFHPDMAPHDTYPCGPAGGDAWLALTVRDGAEWETLCRVIGRPDLAADAALATLEGRRQRRHGLRAPIEAWARVHPAKDAAALLQEAGVAAIPCYRVADLLSDRHLRERGFFIEDPAEPGKVAMMALPWRLHPAGTVTYGRAPDLGDHTEDVLTEAGLHL